MISRALSASHSGPIVTCTEQEPAEKINSAHREQRPLELPREILTFLKCEPVWHCFCHTYLHTMHILHKTRRTNDNRNNSTKQTAVGQKVKFSPWDSRYLGPLEQTEQNQTSPGRFHVPFSSQAGTCLEHRAPLPSLCHLFPPHGLNTPGNTSASMEMPRMRHSWCVVIVTSIDGSPRLSAAPR